MRALGTVSALVRRNLLLYFRDPVAVFFSLLGALIVFLLYALFLGEQQLLMLKEAVPFATAAQVRGLLDAWMFAGIVALATMTTPLAAMSAFVEDFAAGRFRDFLVSPLTRGQLVLGYLLAAFIIGAVMTGAVLLVALAYLRFGTGVSLEAEQVLDSVGWVLLSVAGFASLWALVVTGLRTPAAFSALSTVVGVVSGFIAGAYIAVGMFPDAVRNFVSALPFAQSAMLLRRAFTAEPLLALAGDGPVAVELSSFFGITLEVSGRNVPVAGAALLLAAMAVACALLAGARLRARIRS